MCVCVGSVSACLWVVYAYARAHGSDGILSTTNFDNGKNVNLIYNRFTYFYLLDRFRAL